MKKLIVGLLSAILMSAGLVAATGTVTAQADPYPGTIETKTKAKVPRFVRAPRRVAFCAKVKAVNSNAIPQGVVTLEVRRITGGYTKAKTLNYGGGNVCMLKRIKKPGFYILEATFESPANSVFNKSAGSKGFVVKRRGR